MRHHQFFGQLCRHPLTGQCACNVRQGCRTTNCAHEHFARSLIGTIARHRILIIAGIAGGLIPLGLKELGFDPAISSSIFVTTFTDVGGFFSFLGLAYLAIHYLHAV